MASTPSKSKGAKTTTGSSTTSHSVTSMYRVLEKNHIYISNLEAEERGTTLIEGARMIVKGDRDSVMKEDKARELRRTAMKHACDNELTFLVNVWKKFLDVEEDTRAVKTRADGELEDPEAAIQWIETAWQKDNMKCNWSADFVRGSVPKLLIKDKALKLLVDNAPRVKNPKPDLTYGLHQDAFTDLNQEINDMQGAGLSQNLYHPFFVIEAKSSNNPLTEAVQQCARAGAAMVRLKRKFLGLASSKYDDNSNKIAQKGDEEGEENDDSEEKHKEEQNEEDDDDDEGELAKPIPVDNYRADEASYTFSLALVPTGATLYVNWAEEAFSKEGKMITVNWHQHMIDTYSLEKSKDWKELHRDLDNVLDWGMLKHKNEIQGLCDRIRKHKEEKDSNKKRKIGA